MKKRRYLLVAILIAGIALLLWKKKPSDDGKKFPSNKSPLPTDATFLTQAIATPTSQIPNQNLAGTSERLKNLRDDPEWDYKRKINFYGKVVDESGEPVAGASIAFTWSNAKGEPLSAGNLSDAAGLFSLENKRGKVLQVRVQKDGYYPITRQNQIGFDYAEPNETRFYVPNPQQPVTFYLRKKGVGSELITSQHGVFRSLLVESPSNGIPVAVDFFKRSVGGEGPFIVQGWKEPKSIVTGRNNWAFRISVPDGGLVEHDEEFPFQAPEKEYKTAYEWRFEGHTTNWQASLNKNFYVKFGNPPRYGRIRITTTGFSPSARLEYAVNPVGSRDLEHSSAVKPKQTVFE